MDIKNAREGDDPTENSEDRGTELESDEADSSPVEKSSADLAASTDADVSCVEDSKDDSSDTSSLSAEQGARRDGFTGTSEESGGAAGDTNIRLLSLMTGAVLLIAFIAILLVVASPSEQFGRASTAALVIGLGAINLVTLFSLWMSLSWRKVMSSSGRVALVPEAWGEILRQNTRMTRSSIDIFKALSDLIAKEASERHEQTKLQLAEIIKFQEAIKARDQEIEKLKEGYDHGILKRYYGRLIGLHEEAVKLATEEPESGGVRFLARLSEVLLQDCLITTVEPELLSDSRDLGQLISDQISYEVTPDEAKAHLVASVQKPAYVFDEDGPAQVVKPAVVNVYRYQPTEEKGGDP